MKTLINALILLTLLTSCRVQKYNDGYKEEMEYYKLHPILEKEKTPCINKIYCKKSLYKNDDKYFDKKFAIKNGRSFNKVKNSVLQSMVIKAISWLNKTPWVYLHFEDCDENNN